MKIEVRKSFVKDADKLPAQVQKKLSEIIETISKANQINNLSDCKKLSGYKTAYRIRLGQYRIGFYYDNGAIEFVRALNRKDIYRYFP